MPPFTFFHLRPWIRSFILTYVDMLYWLMATSGHRILAQEECQDVPAGRMQALRYSAPCLETQRGKRSLTNISALLVLPPAFRDNMFTVDVVVFQGRFLLYYTCIFQHEHLQ